MVALYEIIYEISGNFLYSSKHFLEHIIGVIRSELSLYFRN